MTLIEDLVKEFLVPGLLLFEKSRLEVLQLEYPFALEVDQEACLFEGAPAVKVKREQEGALPKGHFAALVVAEVAHTNGAISDEDVEPHHVVKAVGG